MANVDLNSLIAPITSEENLLPESVGKITQKTTGIENTREFKHAAIAKANTDKAAIFDAASLRKKLEIDRPQALSTIKVDTKNVPASEFINSDLPISLAEKFKVYADNLAENTEQTLAKNAAEYEGTRSRTAGEVTGDSLTAFLGQGAVSLGQAAYGLADLGSRVNLPAMAVKAITGQSPSLDKTLTDLGLPGSKGFNQTRQAINETLMSDPAKYQKAAVQADAAGRQAGKAERLAAAAVNGKNTWWDIAKEEGGSFNAGLKSLANNPIELANMTLESGLMMFVPGAIAAKAQKGLVKGMTASEASAYLASEAGQKAAAKLAGSVGVGTTAVLEGMSNAVQAKGDVLAMDEAELRSKSPLYAELLKKGLDPTEARMQVSENVFDSVAVVAGLIGGVTSKYSGAGKLEGQLFKSATGNVAKDTALGALKEGVEETIQSIGGEFAGNLATKQYLDESQELTENLGAAGASGLAAGSLSGGVVTGAGSVTQVARDKATETLIKRGEAKAVDTKITGAISKGVETGDYSELSKLSEEDKEKALAQMVNTETLSNPKLQMDREALTKHLDVGRELLLARNNKLKVKAEASATKLDQLNTAKVDPTDAEYAAAQAEATKDNEALAKATAELKTFVGIRKASKIESGTLKEAIFQVSRDENSTDPETKTTLQNIIRNMGSSLDSFDDSDLEAIAELPNKQASDLAKSALELRTVIGAKDSDLSFKTSDEVNTDLVQGTKEFRGVQTYVQRFKEALATDNKDQATKILNNARYLLKRNQDNIAAYKPKGVESAKQAEYIANLRNEAGALKAAVKYFEKAHQGTFGPGVLSSSPITETEVKVPVVKSTESKTKDVPVFFESVRDELVGTITGLTGQVTVNKKTAKTLDSVQSFFDKLSTKAKPEVVRARLDAYKQGMVDAYNNTVDEANTDKDYLGGAQFIFKNGVAYNTVSDIKRKSIKRMVKDGKQVSRLATYVNQTKTNLTKNPNLQLVPDLASKINAELVSGDLAILKDLNDSEMLAMDSVDSFVKQFTKQFDQLVKIGKTVDGKFTVFDNELEYNPALDFVEETINKDGSISYSLPENLKTAIAVSAFNWLTTESEASDKFNTDDRINAALGRKSGTPVPEEAYDLLLEAGVYANNIESKLGQDVLKLLGVKVSPSAPIEYNLKMANGLGKWATNLLVTMGYSETNYVRTEDMLAINGQAPAKGEKADPTIFIRPKLVGGEVKAELSTFIQQMSEAPMVLDKVFGLVPRQPMPLLEMPTEVRMEVNNSTQQAPKELAELRLKHEQKPHVIREGMSELVSKLSNGFLLRAAGAVSASEMARLHVTEQRTAKTKNQELSRTLQNSLSFLKDYAGKTFYFQHDIWSNMRMGMLGKVNMQANKIDRWLLANANWKVTVDTEQQRNVFKQTIAAQFGVKIEEKTNAEIAAWFTTLVQDPVIRDAVKAVRTLKSGNYTDADQRTLETQLLAGVTAGKENFGTLAAIEALSKYSATKPFETDLVIEIDGKTNGFIFSLIQYAGAASIEALKLLLNRGGLFFDQMQNLSEWVKSPSISGQKNLDSYQAIGVSWGKYLDVWSASLLGKPVDLGSLSKVSREKMADATAVLTAGAGQLYDRLTSIQRLVGSFTDENGDVTDLARKLSKDPLMTTNYGAGIEKIIGNFGEKIIAQFYTKLAKASAKKDAEAIAQLKLDLENVLGTKLDLNLSNALRFTLNTKQSNQFKEQLTATYGIALEGALLDNFGPMLENRKVINGAFAKVSDAYALVFKAKQQEQLAANNNVPLTQEQFENIKTEVDGLFPYLRSYFATTDKNSLALGTFNDNENTQENDDLSNPAEDMGDGVKFAKKHAHANNQVRVEFNLPVPITNGKPRKSASSYVELPEFSYDGVGVRGPALAIQSLDATVMVLTLADFQTHNNHDAHMVSVNDAETATQALNGNFFKVNEKYSLIIEAGAMLDKALEATQQFKNVDGMAEVVAGIQKQAGLLNKPVIKLSNGQMGTIEEGRKDILAAVTYVNQYTMNSGAYAANTFVDTNINSDQDVVNAIDGMFSAPGNMTGFSETTSYQVDTVAGALGVLDQLQSVDVAPTTDTHMTQLRQLMVKFGSVLKPLYLAIDGTKDKTLGRYFEGKKRIEIQLNRVVPVGILRGMSAAETLAHEMAHSFVKTAMDKQTRYTKKLKYLYDLAKTNVKPSDLIERDAAGNVLTNPTPEQIAAGQASWDYLFANPNVRKEKVFNSATNMYEYVNSNDMFQEFIAYTMTNKQLQDVLASNTTLNAAWKKGEPKERTETAAQSGLFKKIDSWLGQFLDYVNDLITGFEFQIYGLKNVTADVGAMDLIYRAVNIQANHSSKIMNSLEKFADVNTQVIDAVSAWIVQPIAKWLAKTPKDGVIKNVATIVTALPETSAEGLNKAVDQLINRAKLSEDTILMKLYREAQGATVKTSKFHILLRMSNTYIDRMRKNVATDVKRMLNSQFTRVLEKSEKSALTRVLLKTDIAAVMQSETNPNGYTLAQLKGLISNPALLQKEIDALNKQITLAEYGNNTYFYTKQAASLGNFLATGVHTEKAGGLNAYVIANMLTTAGFGKKKGDVAKAEAIIDKLATLHALKSTNPLDLSIVAKLIDSESTGVDFVIQTQAYMRKDARNRLFKKTPVQMVKGYTREILNPNVDVIVRPMSDTATLAAEGYTFKRKLPKDSMDPASEMGQFVQRHKKMNSLLAGIVSYTSKGSKGTDLISAYQNELGADNPAAFGRAVTDGAAVKSKLHSHMKDMFSSKMTATDDVNLVPVVSEKGFTSGYRYMMTEANKHELMDKQDSFDEVIGVTLANVQDKLNSQIINQKLVETAKEDFDQYGISDGSEFIAFGPGIGTKEDQELYNLMPDDMKKSIKQIWGSNTMYIRKRNMDIIFGYRRKSAVDFVPNFNNKTLDMAAQTVIRQLNRPGVRMVGSAWQELVTMAKDAIVIKTGTVLAYNILSNTLLLKLAGVPALDILKHHKTAFTATAKYQKEQHELNQLKMEVSINKKLSADQVKTKKSRIAFLENELSTSPVHELIRAGIYQTIVEDLSDEDDAFTYASELEEKTEKFTKYIPQVVKDAGKLVAIGHDTRLYKALRNTTQMSDFVARYTLHQYNLANGMSGPKSIAQIMRTFIDYDPPTHPTIEYANSMGLLMFTKYFIRIQRVLIEVGIKKPGNILMLMLFQGMSGIDIEDPYQAIALDGDNITNKISNPGNVVDAVVTNNLFNFGGL